MRETDSVDKSSYTMGTNLRGQISAYLKSSLRICIICSNARVKLSFFEKNRRKGFRWWIFKLKMKDTHLYVTYYYLVFLGLKFSDHLRVNEQFIVDISTKYKVSYVPISNIPLIFTNRLYSRYKTVWQIFNYFLL